MYEFWAFVGPGMTRREKAYTWAYGLAGLRVGYAVAPEPVAEALRKLGGPARQLQGAPHGRPVAILGHVHGHSLSVRALPENMRHLTPTAGKAGDRVRPDNRISA